LIACFKLATGIAPLLIFLTANDLSRIASKEISHPHHLSISSNAGFQ
jgi:hypothetical protein